MCAHLSVCVNGMKYSIQQLVLRQLVYACLPVCVQDVLCAFCLCVPVCAPCSVSAASRSVTTVLVCPVLIMTGVCFLSVAVRVSVQNC